MHEWTFIISRSRHSGNGSTDSLGLNAEECRRFEDQVAAELRDDGSNVLIVPHIYYLSSSHLAVTRLENECKNIVLASWLHPRAAYWTLKAHGIDGDCASPSEGGYNISVSGVTQISPEKAASIRRCTGSDGGQRIRSIHFCDMSVFSSVDSCVQEIKRVAGLVRGGAVADSQSPTIEDVSDHVSSRWYPVLDYSRCADCKQCLEFCLFGVYSLEEERVVASQPDNCKPGCPACARVCPEGAIMFPHYTSDPAIAGAPGVKISGEAVDIASFFQPSERSMLDRREPALAEHERYAATDSSSPCSCDDSERDDLDDLIEALDRLDD